MTFYAQDFSEEGLGQTPMALFVPLLEFDQGWLENSVGQIQKLAGTRAQPILSFSACTSSRTSISRFATTLSARNA